MPTTIHPSEGEAITFYASNDEPKRVHVTQKDGSVKTEDLYKEKDVISPGGHITWEYIEPKVAAPGLIHDNKPAKGAPKAKTADTKKSASKSSKSSASKSSNGASSSSSSAAKK